jgi:DNA-binding IscR family transcriptional regulator
MPESETTIVFRVLGVLGKAHDDLHPLVLNEIANAAHLDSDHAQQVITLLELAGAVRTEALPTRPACYCLTRYGRERLVGPQCADRKAT